MNALYLIEWPFAAVLIVALICGVVVYGIRQAAKAEERARYERSRPQVTPRLTHGDDD